MAKAIFSYVTYIRATPEKLWSALTDVRVMKQYWFGVQCEINVIFSIVSPVLAGFYDTPQLLA